MEQSPTAAAAAAAAAGGGGGLLSTALTVGMTLLMLWAAKALMRGPRGTRVTECRRRAASQAARHVATAQQAQARGRHADALVAAQRALWLDPRCGAAHLVCAVAQRQLGRPRAALRHMDAAVAVAGGLPAKQRARALLLRADVALNWEKRANERRLKRARADVEAALALDGDGDGDNAEAYGLLGCCLRRLGLLHEAAQAFQRIHSHS